MLNNNKGKNVVSIKVIYQVIQAYIFWIASIDNKF